MLKSYPQSVIKSTNIVTLGIAQIRYAQTFLIQNLVLARGGYSNASCCIILPGCVTTHCSVQDTQSQMLKFNNYSIDAGGPWLNARVLTGWQIKYVLFLKVNYVMYADNMYGKQIGLQMHVAVQGRIFRII